MQTVHSLFEDEHLLAIHKPENVSFHSDDNGEGIVRLVRDSFQSENLFPIHRLDRMTSGLMVFAKTTEANETLSRKLAEKQLEKYYLALASHKPKKKQGMIKGDMEKSRRGSYKLLRSSDNPALTRFFARSVAMSNQSCWGFVLKPETGKTHQLRVALKSLGSPILGDERYGGVEAPRGYLHAYCMRFELFGQRYEIKDTHFLDESSGQTNFHQVFPEIATPHTLPWGKQAFLLD